MADSGGFVWPPLDDDDALKVAMEKLLRDYEESDTNEMEFLLTRTHPDEPNRETTFSKEAVESVVWQIRLFIMHRIMKMYERTGLGTKEMTIKVQIKAR